MSVRTTCLDVELLKRAAAGRIDPCEVGALAEHLVGCERCLQALHTLHGEDTVLDAVRAQKKAHPLANNATIDLLIQKLSALRSLRNDSDPQETFLTGDVPLSVPGPAETYGLLAPSQSADELGRLGGYRVLKVLGAGGMGVVFLAEDPTLKRKVALKAMKPGLANFERAKKRFLREAQSTAQVEHDHIITIYQVGEHHGIPFLAMPLLTGESLEERLNRERRLPLLEVLRIGREMAEGLAVAHEAKLIHRDIKPANIWLEGARARVKILDFGLARPVEGNAQVTQSGTVVGTPAYMAPEQAEGRRVDARVDLFSLGCVLYRMLTGQLPFPGTSMVAVLVAVVHEQPRSVQELAPRAPPELAHLIMRLLAKKPEDRPTKACAVARSEERRVGKGWRCRWWQER